MGMDNNIGGGCNNNKCFPTGWTVEAKLCDYCKSTAAVLFCRTDSFFMCIECDMKAHATTTRHERVWMCEVCEHAPASVTCKADAATLCVTCDHDIHSANPLARRHERSPVVPFYESVESVVKSTVDTLLVPGSDDPNFTTAAVEKNSVGIDTCVAHQEFDSEWNTLQNHINPKGPIDVIDMKSIEYLLSDSDHFADFDYPVPVMDVRFRTYNRSGSDSVVPVQVQPVKPMVPAQMMDHSKENHFEIDFKRSNINSYSSNYPAQTLSHSVSSSSLDVGIVPDGSSMSDMSYPFCGNMSNGLDAVGANHQQAAAQLVGVDREARVLRYREKRKNRKFEKTIRYASRKAYAETRPRIKGRFAKRTEIDAKVVDRIFSSGSTAFMADAAGYGVVPSF